MSRCKVSRIRPAFTLMELLAVLSILALLAVLVVPRLMDVFDRGRSATQAYSLSDVARHVETFFALNKRYPDGWDSLLAAPADTSTPSSDIFPRLAPEVRSPRTYFTTAVLTPDQMTSLRSAGISHVFLHDSVSPASFSGTDRRHFGSGTGHDGTANIETVVIVDPQVGGDGLNLLVNEFGLNPNRSADDTVLPRISTHTYVVLGLGNKCTLVQSQVHEAPILEHASSASNYSRALAVFEVPNAGTKRARLVGVLGPDGRSKSVAIADFNSQVVEPH